MTLSRWCSAARSGYPVGGTIARQLTSTRWQICFAQILLKKSKIENFEKSREGRRLIVYAAARLCRTDTRSVISFV